MEGISEGKAKADGPTSREVAGTRECESAERVGVTPPSGQQGSSRVNGMGAHRRGSWNDCGGSSEQAGEGGQCEMSLPAITQ